ncbi:uncharacterized protein LOC9644689 isoform X2 [Selaginella moellendorffii]|nr:uncharacterized protein LOC9656494 isoform X2 [Selaginella moellendorffii]XP_024544724.1 uncharacterized protein LOC9644689 isoform X2 [Selaginella moellendorffii]|eukprot:XP_024525887.1 uncharacterized protein LOC9656494 isoform X2 [Selaginella moellendorffii]
MVWHDSDSDSDSSCRDHHTTAADRARKDYYKILGVDCDASTDSIRISYLRLALKWHPDKHQGQDSAATLKFQEINEAYTVLSDPAKRRDYDMRADFNVQEYSIIEYLNRFKGLILTCNGLGIGDLSEW